jgi:3',5'-cyclic AMP phosphodiesterase CpdA
VEGAVERSSLALARELLGARGQSAPIVLVTHHPLAFHPSSDRAGHNVLRGDELLGLAAGSGVDLLLSGHTHRPYGGSPFPVDVAGRRMVAAHGGTACSTRTRAGEPPSWQSIELSPDRIAIEAHRFDAGAFTGVGPSVWVRDQHGSWSPA